MGKLSVPASLGPYQTSVELALAEMDRERIIERIWDRDYTVWKHTPTEISNRLGWLYAPRAMSAEISRLEQFAEQVCSEGYTHALLLGMGGSSLAPEVLRKTFGVRPGFLDLAILDSTDPEAVLRHARQLDPAKTLYIVSTKSGGTVETFSFFKFFYNLVTDRLGAEQSGSHFIAITDPGSGLADLAVKLNFRKVFLNDPNIGGRYSALSFFGLVPAALLGMELETLLERAIAMADACMIPSAADNPGACLGAILGELARKHDSLEKRDKLTPVLSPTICTFGDWIEQLIAESTGKEGQGILPVVGEKMGEPPDYGDDRLFVSLRVANDHSFDLPTLALERAGFPVVRLEMRDLYDLGAQFFLWEMATVIAGQRLGIQPFDQPNVEVAKAQARQVIAAYQENGSLPESPPALQEEGIKVYGEVHGSTLAQVWRGFLAQAEPGAYIALQAYIPPGEASDASLLALRTELRQRTRLAVTSGYGPRYLHSTGQLHKGDGGKGLFVQITADPTEDAPIPDEAGAPGSSVSFGLLEKAQALGDYQALLNAGRKVIRLHLGQDVQLGLARLLQSLRANGEQA